MLLKLQMIIRFVFRLEKIFDLLLKSTEIAAPVNLRCNRASHLKRNICMNINIILQ